MTIKQFINKYFESKVVFNYDRMVFDEEAFWRAWDDLQKDMVHSVQMCFEWYDDRPAISDKREEFIKKAVDNYIRKNLKPKYTNRGL